MPGGHPRAAGGAVAPTSHADAGGPAVSEAAKVGAERAAQQEPEQEAEREGEELGVKNLDTLI